MKFLWAAVTLALSCPGLTAADSSLLSLVMNDAKVVAGIDWQKARGNALGGYALTHIPPGTPSLRALLAQAGVDASRDISEAVLASAWAGDSPKWLVLARGTFPFASVHSWVQASNGASAAFVLSTSVAALGDPALVRAAAERFQAKTPPDARLTAGVSSARAGRDFWFLTLAPLSQFAGLITDPNLSQAISGELFAAITGSSGGAAFGPIDSLTVQATARSDKDAAKLSDAVRFLLGLLQSAKSPAGSVTPLASLLKDAKLTSSGSQVTLSLQAADSRLKEILDSAAQAPKAPRAVKP